MNQDVFTYAQRAEFRALLDRLVDTGEQFSVTPYPQDLQATRTGWSVAYPAQPAEQVGHDGAVA